eukprot:TRINITY_DN448_c0_g1_i1.p2 TRINITY_DN448_c0_g1~~TRINITY_DN448_c0_g1_i1.p2  ORF type:complete len:394 (-),score=213.17 TRINITY_DN448_c0_g1_i1:317-1498(-)
MKFLLLALALVAFASAEVFFSEEFSDESWEGRWVKSTNKGSDAGEFIVTPGEFYKDAVADRGLKTNEDYRFYQISAKFEPFSNKDKTLVFQFSAKHEQNLDCGGGYFKLLPAGVDQEDFNGDTDYFIMFGPDICGSSTKRVHAILNYKGENHLIKKDIPAPKDVFTHVYTLILRPDQTFEVLVDNESVRSGNLVDEWDFLPPKEIKDPNVSKPDDWVDAKFIDDPEDSKPDGWDDIEEFIADPDAEQPEDWDEELDGEWEPPMIENPEFQGEWKPKQIKNPEYKGPWEHPLIDNPEYSHDDSIYAFENIGTVGLEVWQVKAGTIFDNILVTDDVELAAQWADRALDSAAAEKELKEKADEEQRQRDEEERARMMEEMEEEEDFEEEEFGHDEL